MFDVLITLAEKDFLKLRFVVESIINNVEEVDNIYCVSNVKVPDTLKVLDVSVIYLLDEDVLDFDFGKLIDIPNKRKGWYKQQFIKLFQRVTSDDYLVVDSDIYFNKQINIIQGGRPTFLFGKDQHHRPYFQFMKDLLDLGREYNFSFINEVMYFKWSIIQDMLDRLAVTKEGFFELAVKEINKLKDASGFSEYELYGNYVTKYFPDDYNYKHILTQGKAKREIWTREEMMQYIESFKDSNTDIIKMHSWI
jgi:hypothetical protein